MKILVIGSGGREHALVWKILQSPLVKKIYCAPGNAGIFQIAECVNISVEKISDLLKFALSEKIDLTVVGPELPLTLGIVDEFEKANLKIFGPSKAASQLEGSKYFAKSLMRKYGIPTAPFESFSDFESAKKYLMKSTFPLVIKADGLAAGKGVLVSKNIQEAHEFLEEVMVKKIFGNAGNVVVIEECLVGEEISVLALLDGKTIIPLPEARDHKRIFDEDDGLNTGGMGAYSPVTGIPNGWVQDVVNKVFLPLQEGMTKDGIKYKGVLYAGLMMTAKGPQVLEFNVRFGDPETQVILPRLETDLVDMMVACSSGTLSKMKIEINPQTAICIVLTSGGYPGSYKNGYEIKGLSDASKTGDVIIFHAGTQKKGTAYLTNGGRVLGIAGLGRDMTGVREKVYSAIKKISFEGMHYRRDIGLKVRS